MKIDVEIKISIQIEKVPFRKVAGRAAFTHLVWKINIFNYFISLWKGACFILGCWTFFYNIFIIVSCRKWWYRSSANDFIFFHHFQIVGWADLKESVCDDPYKFMCSNFINQYKNHELYLVNKGEWNAASHFEYESEFKIIIYGKNW